mgnify:CR=1 FL=1
MAYRFRATLKFNSNGITNSIAGWCDNQASQRMDMAFHINQGARNEEQSYHNVENNGEFWRCNIFVPDDSQSILEDLFAQIESIWSNVYTPQNEMDMRGRMDIHKCYNDENKPCEQPYMVKKETYSEIEEWVQPKGSHDAYNIGDKVTHNGDTWESTIDANTYEPGIYGWVKV